MDKQWYWDILMMTVKYKISELWNKNRTIPKLESGR